MPEACNELDDDCDGESDDDFVCEREEAAFGAAIVASAAESDVPHRRRALVLDLGGRPFDRVFLAPAWADESGLGAAAHQATIRIAGGRLAASPAGSGEALVGSCSARPLGSRGAWTVLVLLAAAVLRRRPV